MTTHAKTLEELIRELPPQSRDEVRDFVELLLARQKPAAQTELPSEADAFERLFGSWDSGDPNSADNERSDADLAREYADPHDTSN